MANKISTYQNKLITKTGGLVKISPKQLIFIGSENKLLVSDDFCLSLNLVKNLNGNITCFAKTETPLNDKTYIYCGTDTGWIYEYVDGQWNNGEKVLNNAIYDIDAHTNWSVRAFGIGEYGSKNDTNPWFQSDFSFSTGRIFDIEDIGYATIWTDSTGYHQRVYGNSDVDVSFSPSCVFRDSVTNAKYVGCTNGHIFKGNPGILADKGNFVEYQMNKPISIISKFGDNIIIVSPDASYSRPKMITYDNELTNQINTLSNYPLENSDAIINQESLFVFNNDIFVGIDSGNIWKNNSQIFNGSLHGITSINCLIIK